MPTKSAIKKVEIYVTPTKPNYPEHYKVVAIYRRDHMFPDKELLHVHYEPSKASLRRLGRVLNHKDSYNIVHDTTPCWFMSFYLS